MTHDELIKNYRDAGTPPTYIDALSVAYWNGYKEARKERVADQAEPDDLGAWMSFVLWVERCLVLLGVIFLIFAISAFSGYHIARGALAKPEAVASTTPPPCGSCRLGTNR